MNREHLDKLTKPLLIAEVERLQKAEVARVAAAPAAVPEADALARCIRALDTLTRRSNNYPGGDHPDTDAITRLLRNLAAKYGVSLIEVREQPCSRTHVDHLDPFQIGSTVINNLGSLS